MNERHSYFYRGNSLNVWVMCLGLVAGYRCLCARAGSRDCLSSSIRDPLLDAQAKPLLVARRQRADFLFPAVAVRPGK